MDIIFENCLVQEPLVSVIVPSYNRKETVGFTLDSILQQICDFSIELIIGDDCSTDGVREVLLSYQQRYPNVIKLLFHDTNIGLAANWAKCVQHCRGKYIANCDNDDYWHNNNKLQLQVNFMQDNLNYGVVHTNYRFLNRKNGKVKDIVVENNASESIQSQLFAGKYNCCNAAMMYRAELLRKYLNLNDFIKYKFTLQDWNAWVILSAYTDFYCLNISTATVCVGDVSVTRPNEFIQLEKRLLLEKECYKYVCDLFPHNLKYLELDYDTYSLKVLLNFTYSTIDYKNGNAVAEKLIEIGVRNYKVRIARIRICFYLYALLRKLYKEFSSNLL